MKQPPERSTDTKLRII